MLYDYDMTDENTPSKYSADITGYRRNKKLSGTKISSLKLKTYLKAICNHVRSEFILRKRKSIWDKVDSSLISFYYKFNFLLQFFCCLLKIFNNNLLLFT